MLKIDEKDLENIIYECAGSKEGLAALSQRGLNLKKFDSSAIERQVNLKDYGIADLIKVDMKKGFISVNVIELKVVKFANEHLLQLGRYMSCLQNLLENFNINYWKYEVRGTLVVSQFDSNTDATWYDRIISDRISVYSTEYTINGLSFRKELPNGWRLSSPSENLGDYTILSEYLKLYKISCEKDSLSEQPF